MTPRIPLELSDYILDALSTDHKTVGVCGLVSIDWVPRSRHILFSTVNLSSSNSRRFHQLLGSPACTFASSVSHLGIAAETDAGTVQEAFYRLVTSSSFGRLACVQSLQLSNVDWTCFSVSQQSSLESGLARLTHLAKLELRSMSFHDLKGALRVVSFFPFIHHIRLIDVRFSKYLEYNISSAKTHQIPLAWQVIEIDAGDAIPSFLHCLSANLAVAPVGIRLLKFLHINPGHYPYVEEALRTIDFKPPSVLLLPENCDFPLTTSPGKIAWYVRTPTTK